VSHDGSPGARAFGPGGPGPGGFAAAAAAGNEGSLLLAGNLLDVSHAYRSVVSSPGLVRVSHAHGVAFLDSPQSDIANENNCQRVPAPAGRLALTPPGEPNPLDGKLTVTQVVGGDDPTLAMAVIAHGGVELVVRLGAAITDGQGKPLPVLEGWTLSFVGDRFALFTRTTDPGNPPQRAGFDLNRKP
jgi:hypothetical protein